jgi:hypothetical protein
MLGTGRNRGFIPLRPLLVADAGFELLAAIALAAAAGPLSRWLDISSIAAYALAAIFLAAAAGVGYLARQPAPERAVVRALALANVLGGALGWVLLTLAWGSFDPPGRAVLGSAADVFVGLGVLELLALAGPRVPRE